jgi:hypothetical protein
MYYRKSAAPLTAGLHMCGFREDAPVATLGLCALRSGSAPQHTSLLLILCRDCPASLLDLDTSDVPPAFSMRWALVMGSICDLCIGTPAHRAPFWNALLATVASPQVAEQVALFGQGHVDDVRAVTLENDTSAWAKWLAVAALSGLLQEELAQGPDVLSHALAARFSAPPHASSQNITCAATLQRGVLPSGFRKALALLRSIDVLAAGCHLSAAALLARLMACAAPGSHDITLHSLYATLTAATVKSVPALLRARCPAATSGSSNSVSTPLSTASAVAERTQSHREAVRASLLSAGTPGTAPLTSLCTLLALLLGSCQPFLLLELPPELNCQRSTTPPQVFVDLIHDLLEGMLCCLCLCSTPTILSASSRCTHGAAPAAASASAGPLSSDSAILSTVILEELATAVACTTAQDVASAQTPSPGRALWRSVERSVDCLRALSLLASPLCTGSLMASTCMRRLCQLHFVV